MPAPARSPATAVTWFWTGMLTDVSDRKAMEAGLRASEEQDRYAGSRPSPQGVIYHDTADASTSANPAAMRILGCRGHRCRA